MTWQLLLLLLLSTSAALQMSAATSTTAAVAPASARPKVIIAGGGPAGALAAVYLGRSGLYSVDVYESRPPHSYTAPKNDRTYNVVVFPPGLAALTSAGVDLYSQQFADIVKISVSTYVRAKGAIKEMPGFAKGYPSVDRGDVAQRLLDIAAALPDVKVHYGAQFQSLDLKGSSAVFTAAGSGNLIEQVCVHGLTKSDFAICCNLAHSSSVHIDLNIDFGCFPKLHSKSL